MKQIFLRIGLCFLLFFFGCSKAPTDTVSQVSTIDALLAGSYDGIMSCENLLKYGNFGIGTFDRLDGEMILYDGKFYQVKSDGSIVRPNLGLTTPFASVCFFVPDRDFYIQKGSDYKDVKKLIDEAVPNKNIFCAIRIKGNFLTMKTRSVPAQSKPYPELTEVTKNQPVFYMENIKGTIVGFRCPDFVKGVNVPGYHLHFISDDLSNGGHILGFTVKEGVCEVDICDKYFLILPDEGKGLKDLDLSRNRSNDLEKVEK
ncbi:MAG: acetolactate decarboxylase [Candidatus Omnitrophota bacterium]